MPPVTRIAWTSKIRLDGSVIAAAFNAVTQRHNAGVRTRQVIGFAASLTFNRLVCYGSSEAEQGLDPTRLLEGPFSSFTQAVQLRAYLPIWTSMR